MLDMRAAKSLRTNSLHDLYVKDIKSAYSGRNARVLYFVLDVLEETHA